MPFEKIKNILLWLFVRPFRPQTKQYWRVVLLCFVAASTFWLLNALNKSYSTQITYPIRFLYNENKLMPVRPLPEEVSINVTGKGWKLLRKSLMFEVQPADIFIRNLPRNNYLLGSALRPALVNALDGLELNFVATDTLFFDFDAKVTRKVGLQLDPNQKLTGDRSALAGPVGITPDSITFTGPSTMVDTIPDPILLRLPNQGLTESAKVEVPVPYSNRSLVKANVDEAVVTLNIKNLLQEERQLVPELVNFPAGRDVTLRPPFVLVRYQLLEDSAATLNRTYFRAVLDFAKYNWHDSTLVPELVQTPAGVRNAKLWPERVKATIETQ
ncbi:hypothetical protein ACFSKU_07465 [Pontibacter silvestris]|uniref:YbbR-like domain-containing protein n=1 Tax=Pontibacter silvestris TaxID=2305183 RepID=A0ABW4WWZ1_9BACT|nr:hypothetical protein [Pontibacter silvestris]MCC9136628.1 hypothetical protein [Pontibacter silvestris]